jgi:glycosyltransferase involved in cell wall biosynthesis
MARPMSAMIVTKIFPPEAAVGVHRITGLCRYLVRRGWDVSVLTCRLDRRTKSDDDLLQLVPKGIRIVRTPAPELLAMASSITKGKWIRSFFRFNSPPKPESVGEPEAATAATASPVSASRSGRIHRAIDWLTWWLQVPDQYIGWLIPAVAAGLARGISRRPSVIFSTAPKWTSHLVAATLSHLLRVPLVADFRDPWCGSAFRGVPGGAHGYLDAVMERMVINRSVRITCAWDGIRRHLLKRYPNRAADISTIINGYNPELIDGIAPEFIDPARCVLLHAGSFYGPRRPEPLLEALRRLKDTIPQISQRLAVVLLGPTAYNGRPLERMVGDYGLTDLVHINHPVPHRQAVAMIKGADAAVLFGQSGMDELASVPAKVFEMAGMHKPTLAIGAGQESCAILRRGGSRLWESSAGDPAAIAKAIREIMACRDRGELSRTDAAHAASLTDTYMAARLEQILLQAISSTHGGRHAV